MSITFVLALREEVINVSFYGNMNKIRNRQTKNFERHFTGNFQNLTVKWVYENETFIFKNSDTLYVWVGFLLRDGNTFWDVKPYEIWYWRVHSIGISTTTATTTLLDFVSFDILEPNIGKLHPQLKQLFKTTRKATKRPHLPKSYITSLAHKGSKKTGNKY